jgi:plasmid stabilization system protein ParE
MSRRLIVRTEAEKDVAAAAQWYEERSSGLSLRFRASLDRALSLIENNPELYAPVYRGLRRALLRRFPYGVFYIPRDEDIIVVAVLHTSRDPGLWEARLKAGVS